MNSRRLLIVVLVLGAAMLFSFAPVSKDRPPVEIAYTQDGANCIRGRVRDQNNSPIEGARVTLVLEGSLAGVATTGTDKRGEFLFRSVPLKEELLLLVEADGFQKTSVPGIKIVPPYSCVTTVRLQKAAPAK